MARRKSDQRKVCNDFYIITNGAQTEKNYFDLLKAKHSVYSVHVKFENADPLGLVEYAKGFLNNANQIWCVFDIDYTHDDGRLVPALNLAEQYGIKIAYSNKAFEVWLISHFKTFRNKMPIGNYSGVLTACLNDIGYSDAYDKTDKSLLQKYFIPNYKAAIDNAKSVYQHYVKQHNEECGPNSKMPIWEWDASTTVFKLVEALKLRS